MTRKTSTLSLQKLKRIKRLMKARDDLDKTLKAVSNPEIIDLVKRVQKYIDETISWLD
jgi:mevalonate kinase